MNNYQKLFFIIVLSILISSPVFVSAQSFYFYRSLNVGSTGQDVLMLQKFLNQDPATMVSLSGVGSVGQETNYYGELTKQAVAKFQNKYRQQVLIPVGLTSGTGYFGPSTRNFINGLVKNSVVIETPVAPAIQPTSPPVDLIESSNSDPALLDPVSIEISNSEEFKENKSKIQFISFEVVEVGDDLLIVADNIDDDSEILFKNENKEKIIDNIDRQFNFMYFDTPNLDKGEYDLYVKNGDVLSDPVVVKIVDDLTPPQIDNVALPNGEPVRYGDKIIIKGDNFENINTVMTALGSYEVEAKGGRLEFIVEGQPVLNSKGEIFEGMIQVKNSNGHSNLEFIDFVNN